MGSEVAAYPGSTDLQRAGHALMSSLKGCSNGRPLFIPFFILIRPETRNKEQNETMYIEQGPCKASQGELVHESDVIEAYALARHGYQRLRPISETGVTLIKFTVWLSGHETQTVYRISPVTSGESRQSRSDIDGRYLPCCDQVVDDQIRSCILAARKPDSEQHSLPPKIILKNNFVVRLQRTPKLHQCGHNLVRQRLHH